MPLRERAYYGLDEIQARLKLTRRELLYLVENGLLKASVRVWDAVIEEGEHDRAADGRTFRLPTDQRRFSGLLDLRPQDAYRLFRDQMAVINAFDEAGSSCTRMADLFKSQRHWRELIASDGRGHYRLAIPCAQAIDPISGNTVAGGSSSPTIPLHIPL